MLISIMAITFGYEVRTFAQNFFLVSQFVLMALNLALGILRQSHACQWKENMQNIFNAPWKSLDPRRMSGSRLVCDFLFLKNIKTMSLRDVLTAVRMPVNQTHSKSMGWYSQRAVCMLPHIYAEVMGRKQ